MFYHLEIEAGGHTTVGKKHEYFVQLLPDLMSAARRVLAYDTDTTAVYLYKNGECCGAITENPLTGDMIMARGK